jgi:hypothetical protein
MDAQRFPLHAHKCSTHTLYDSREKKQREGQKDER